MPNNFVAIIQARMGSTRSPGKVLTPLSGLPMLKHIISRLETIKSIDQIVLAIPDTPENDTLFNWAKENYVNVVKGPEKDVLQRFIVAAESFQANQIMRICADSPLVDPSFMENLANNHKKNSVDFSAIFEDAPIGTVFPIVSLKALKYIADRTQANRYREHVTTYIEDYPQDFTISRLPAPSYLKGKCFRLTVDVKEDLELMKIIYNRYFKEQSPVVNLETVIAFLENNPDIAKINAHVEQNNWRQD